MKPNIHPEYNQIKAKCACGSEFTTGSTLKEIRVEICSACHPFFTGKQKFIDTAGRVARFEKKYAKHFEKVKEEEDKARDTDTNQDQE